MWECGMGVTGISEGNRPASRLQRKLTYRSNTRVNINETKPTYKANAEGHLSCSKSASHSSRLVTLKQQMCLCYCILSIAFLDYMDLNFAKWAGCYIMYNCGIWTFPGKPGECLRKDFLMYNDKCFPQISLAGLPLDPRHCWGCGPHHLTWMREATCFQLAAMFSKIMLLLEVLLL